MVTFGCQFLKRQTIMFQTSVKAILEERPSTDLSTILHHSSLKNRSRQPHHRASGNRLGNINSRRRSFLPPSSPHGKPQIDKASRSVHINIGSTNHYQSDEWVIIMKKSCSYYKRTSRTRSDLVAGGLKWLDDIGRGGEGFASWISEVLMFWWSFSHDQRHSTNKTNESAVNFYQMIPLFLTLSR